MEPSETDPNVDLAIGDVVVFHDERGEPHSALVNCIHSRAPYYCVNLVLVSANENERDQYGRQIERRTSVQHASAVGAHGMYWRRDDERPNVYTQPDAV